MEGKDDIDSLGVAVARGFSEEEIHLLLRAAELGGAKDLAGGEGGDGVVLLAAGRDGVGGDLVVELGGQVRGSTVVVVEEVELGKR